MKQSLALLTFILFGMSSFAQNELMSFPDHQHLNKCIIGNQQKYEDPSWWALQAKNLEEKDVLLLKMDRNGKSGSFETVTLEAGLNDNQTKIISSLKSKQDPKSSYKCSSINWSRHAVLDHSCFVWTYASYFEISKYLKAENP